MFSTNKNRKIGMLIFLFVVSFIVGMLINIQRLGSLPMKLIQVEWNDTVGCVYENLDYENPSDHKYDLYVPKNLDTPESKCLILYIHGGSFNSGSKEDGDAWCKYYTSKGYVTATVDYTLQSKKGKSEEELLNASLELMNPANFFGADIRLQGKVDAYCHADRQHRADKLPGVQPEKDVFVVVADFFWYFDFYSRHLRKEKRRYAICTAAFFIIDISYNFVSRGRFCKFPRYFLIHQF